MTLKEAKELIVRLLIANGVKEEYAELFNGDTIMEVVQDLVEFEGYTIKEEAAFGGFEGGGDTAWIVFSISKDDTVVYIRVSGYYNSWNVTDWHTEDLVKPKEVTVIEWDAVKN